MNNNLIKISILLLILFSRIGICEDAIEFIGGSLTYHVIATGSNIVNNQNKLSKDGKLIDNPIFGLSKSHTQDGKFTSVIIFGGENSIAYAIAGSLFEFGYDWKYLQLGGVIGGYLQTDNGFIRRGINPFDFDVMPNLGIVPVAGGAINLKLPINENVYFKINNIISPVIINTTLSIGIWF